MRTLIGFAFKLSVGQTHFLISGLPDWVDSEWFDVEARAPIAAPSKDQFRLMLQSLFADRFKLRVHHEITQGPEYDLVLAKPGKLGPNLRKYEDDPPCRSAGQQSSSPVIPGVGELPPNCGVLVPMKPSEPGLLKAGTRNSSMAKIADYMITLFNGPDLPVLDHTGLAGTFDFPIEWSPQASNPAAGPQAEPVGPTIQEALQDQLGLKLVSATGQIDRLVIDHIEEPTPN